MRMGCLGQLLTGLFVFLINATIIGLVALIRILPIFMPIALQALEGFIILSYRLYSWLFSQVNPILRRRLKFDLFVGHWRTILTILLSFVLGIVLFLIFSIPINWFTIALTILHGVSVCQVGRNQPRFEGITTGVRIPWEK